MSKDHIFIPFLNSTSMHMQAFRGSIKGSTFSWRHKNYLRGSSFRRCARYHDRLASHGPYRRKWGVGKLVCRRGSDQRSIGLERLQSFRKVGSICLKNNLAGKIRKWVGRPTRAKLGGHSRADPVRLDKESDLLKSRTKGNPINSATRVKWLQMMFPFLIFIWTHFSCQMGRPRVTQIRSGSTENTRVTVYIQIVSE